MHQLARIEFQSAFFYLRGTSPSDTPLSTQAQERGADCKGMHKVAPPVKFAQKRRGKRERKKKEERKEKK